MKEILTAIPLPMSYSWPSVQILSDNDPAKNQAAGGVRLNLVAVSDAPSAAAHTMDQLRKEHAKSSTKVCYCRRLNDAQEGKETVDFESYLIRSKATQSSPCNPGAPPESC
jgi:hypothetical protein